MSFLPYILIIALINSCIELEITAPSLPSIMYHFSVDIKIAGLITTIYLIGFFLSALIVGPLSDRYGRRKVMLIGNGILAIGVAVCVFAPTITVLLLARLAQGFGAATSAVIVSAIIADCYESNAASKLYAIMNAVFTAIMAVSPIVGGFLNATVGWRGIYGCMTIICMLSWTVLFLLLPETAHIRKKINIKHLILEYKTLIFCRAFMAAAAIPSLLYAGYLSFITIGAIIYLKSFGLNQTCYIMYTFCVVFSFATTSFLYTTIINSVAVKALLNSAFIIMCSSCFLMYLDKGPILFTLGMCFFSIGFALIYPPIFSKSMEMHPKIKGTASSLIISFRYLICSTFVFYAAHINISPKSIAILLSVIITISVLCFHSIRDLQLEK